jgi:hypothetical protein
MMRALLELSSERICKGTTSSQLDTYSSVLCTCYCDSKRSLPNVIEVCFLEACLRDWGTGLNEFEFKLGSEAYPDG